MNRGEFFQDKNGNVWVVIELNMMMLVDRSDLHSSPNLGAVRTSRSVRADLGPLVLVEPSGWQVATCPTCGK